MKLEEFQTEKFRATNYLKICYSKGERRAVVPHSFLRIRLKNVVVSLTFFPQGSAY